MNADSNFILDFVPLSAEALRARRYRNAQEIKPLAEHPPRNRICVGGIELAWEITGWRNVFYADDGFVQIKEQQHTVAIYENAQAIGKAVFTSYWFKEDASYDDFLDAADSVDDKFCAMAYGTVEALNLLSDFASFWEGMRFVEFTRLAMRPEHAGSSKWVKPINTFIDRKFKKTSSAFYVALVLKPYPLEFECGSNYECLGKDIERCYRRRRAMARMYKRTLGVEMVVPATENDWWMGRLL